MERAAGSGEAQRFDERTLLQQRHAHRDTLGESEASRGEPQRMETEKALRQCSLAGPGGADHGHEFTMTHVQVDAIENEATIPTTGERFSRAHDQSAVWRRRIKVAANKPAPASARSGQSGGLERAPSEVGSKRGNVA